MIQYEVVLEVQTMGSFTGDMPFGDYARKGGRVKKATFGEQVAKYLQAHDAPLDIDAEGERSLKILLGILDGEIDASVDNLKIVNQLVGKLVPGAQTRKTEEKREDPGEYIGRAMEENGASFNRLQERAREWALEAESKTKAVMEALAGEVE
jgi:hypothetical protein